MSVESLELVLLGEEASLVSVVVVIEESGLGREEAIQLGELHSRGNGGHLSKIHKYNEESEGVLGDEHSDASSQENSSESVAQVMAHVVDAGQHDIEGQEETEGQTDGLVRRIAE